MGRGRQLTLVSGRGWRCMQAGGFFLSSVFLLIDGGEVVLRLGGRVSGKVRAIVSIVARGCGPMMTIRHHAWSICCFRNTVWEISSWKASQRVDRGLGHVSQWV
jgi:hypothetical protein